MGPLNSSLFLASSQRTRFLGSGRKSGCLQNRPSLLSKVSVNSFRGLGLAKKSGSPGFTPSRGPGSDGGQGAVIPLNFQGPAAYLEARNTLGLESQNYEKLATCKGRRKKRSEAHRETKTIFLSLLLPHQLRKELLVLLTGKRYIHIKFPLPASDRLPFLYSYPFV